MFTLNRIRISLVCIASAFPFQSHPALAQAQQRGPGVLFVDTHSPQDGPGDSWSSAYNDLQAALQIAQADLSIGSIHIAQGTYMPTLPGGRQSSFSLVSGVGLRGGFAGFGASNPDEQNPAVFQSILDGNLGQPGLQEDNAYHVVIANHVRDGALVEGLIIENGNNTGAPREESSGAGIRITGGSPVFVRCVFRKNTSDSVGAAVATREQAMPAFVNCDFESNSGRYAGAVYAYNSDVRYLNCRFYNNHQTGGNGEAGAIYEIAQSQGTLINCTVVGNTSNQFNSGAIFRHPGTPGKMLILNSVFANNSDRTGSKNLGNNHTKFDVRFSCLSGQPQFDDYAGEGTIANDPLLNNLASGDLRLTGPSPCVDTGLSSFVPDDQHDINHNGDTFEATPDFDLNNRFFSSSSASRVDMGAYEFGSFPSPPATCPGDINGDGLVDFEDLLFVINNYGMCGS